MLRLIQQSYETQYIYIFLRQTSQWFDINNESSQPGELFSSDQIVDD